MSKWKCEICGKEFENFHAQGFDNKIYCPLCFFKEENRRLKDKINTYEDPEDLTLMFMYCDEKAKDKIKQLKEEINKMSKKEIKVRDMLYSIENGTLTRERLMQIEEVLFEIGGEDNE